MQTGGTLFVQARTVGAPGVSVASVRQAITDLDQNLLVDVRTTAEVASFELTMRRIATMVLAAMGGLGLLLATLGLFGVLAWDVSRRFPEIGVRMALGASHTAVHGLIVRDAFVLVGVGTAIGVATSLLVTLTLRAFLAGVSTADPVTIAAVMGVLLLVSLVASWIPARRATRIDPSVALRCD